MDYNQLVIVRHTTNFEAMVSFYRDGLGLDVVESWDDPGNRGVVLAATGAMSGVHLEVLDLNNLTVPDTAPVNLELSFRFEDVTAWHDELVARGVAIARGLEDAPWGKRSFGVDDPDGLRIWCHQDL